MSHCHTPSAGDMARGAYIAIEPHGGLADGAVICGEEDLPAVKKAAAIMSVLGMAARIVAVRDFDLFSAQDGEYRRKVLCPDLALAAVLTRDCPWRGKTDACPVALGEPAKMARDIMAAISK